MPCELPLTPQARRHVLSARHLELIRLACLEPVERHPADEQLSAIGSVLGRRRGTTQVRVGADGTRVTVAWDGRSPARIIHVSPPGGET